MSVDANTVISNGSNTLSFRGAQNYVFDSAFIGTLTVTNGLIGTGIVNSTNILDGTILGADISTGTITGANISAGTITGTNISAGSILASNISANSLDFAQFKDSMSVDANTVISNGANTLTFRGAQNYVFDSALIGTLTVTNGINCTGCINSTNILDGTITSADISAGAILAANLSANSLDFAQFKDSMTLDANTVISGSS